MSKKKLAALSAAVIMSTTVLVYIIKVNITKVDIIMDDPEIAISTVQTSAAVAGAPKLIIDAGHGGIDNGAVSDNGKQESKINLDVALKLDQIVGFLGHSSLLTRTGEDIDYSDDAGTIHEKKVEDLKRRVALVNATDNAYLISIHQNKYPDGGPFGAEVLYAPTERSKALAEYLQNLLVQTIDATNRRKAAQIPGSIYMMNNVNCPAVLIECGFLSNAKEEALLKTSEYRLKLAATIAAGYFTFISGGDGGTNEG